MLINYISIGILILFLIENIVNSHSSKIEFVEGDTFVFSNPIRIFCVIIWPITLAVVLKHTIQWVKNILK